MGAASDGLHHRHVELLLLSSLWIGLGQWQLGYRNGKWFGVLEAARGPGVVQDRRAVVQVLDPVQAVALVQAADRDLVAAVALVQAADGADQARNGEWIRIRSGSGSGSGTGSGTGTGTGSGPAGPGTDQDQAREAAAGREVAPDQEPVLTQEAARAPRAVRARVLGAEVARLLALELDRAPRRDLGIGNRVGKGSAPENQWDAGSGSDVDVEVDRARAADQVPAAVAGRAWAVAQAVERVREQEVERRWGRVAERDRHGTRQRIGQWHRIRNWSPLRERLGHDWQFGLGYWERER